MKTLAVLLIFSFIGTLCFAQFDTLGLKMKWNKGDILLKDNSLHKGFIQHNDKLGLIKFKEDLKDDGELSFQEKSILKMQYVDREISKSRIFIALTVDDDQRGFKGALLFEVVLELKEFAVLSKISSVEPALRERNDAYGRVYHAKVGYEQFEHIYLAGADSKIELLLETSVLEKDKLKPLSKKIKPLFNKDIMKKYIGTKWPLVNDYIQEKQLKLTEKQDLITAFEYYNQLEKG